MHQAWRDQVAGHADIGEAPAIGNMHRRIIVDCDLDAGLQIEAYGKEDLDARGIVAFALDKIDTHGRLSGVPTSAGRGTAGGLAERVLEAELAPGRIGDVAWHVLAPRPNLGFGELVGRLRGMIPLLSGGGVEHDPS